jgi:hypothetical protein
MEHEHVVERHQRRDRDQVLVRVERHLGVERRVDRLDTAGAHEQRVAVGRRARGLCAAEVAAGAGLVLDRYRMAEDLLSSLAVAREGDVDRARGRERADQAQRLGREILGGGGQREQQAAAKANRR